MPPNFLDLVIRDLANENAAADDRIVSLMADCRAYQLLAHVALEQVATLTRTNRRQQDTIVRLHEILRDERAADRERVA